MAIVTSDPTIKADLEQVETIRDEKQNDNIEMEDDIEKVDVKNSNADYSGAKSKTDQKEIGLVRKLDLRIMPILWAMYFMNYVCLLLTPGATSILTHVSGIARPKRDRQC